MPECGAQTGSQAEDGWTPAHLFEPHLSQHLCCAALCSPWPGWRHGPGCAHMPATARRLPTSPHPAPAHLTLAHLHTPTPYCAGGHCHWRPGIAPGQAAQGGGGGLAEAAGGNHRAGVLPVRLLYLGKVPAMHFCHTAGPELVAAHTCTAACIRLKVCLSFAHVQGAARE